MATSSATMTLVLVLLGSIIFLVVAVVLIKMFLRNTNRTSNIDPLTELKLYSELQKEGKLTDEELKKIHGVLMESTKQEQSTRIKEMPGKSAPTDVSTLPNKKEDKNK